MGSVSPRGIRGDSAVQRFERQEAKGWLPRGWIDGLTLSNDGTDATNDVAIAAGSCRSTSNIGPDGIRTTLPKYQADLELPVSIIKQLDVAWEPENYDPENGIGGGARSGMRSSSSISNTTWHIYAIGGFDCPTDIFAHDGADPSAVLPNGYTAWRRIGSILRESAAIVAFVQRGNHFARNAVSTVISATNPGTSAVLRTLVVPVGIVVTADIFAHVGNANASNHAYCLISDPATTDEVPAAGLGNVQPTQAVTGFTGDGVAPLLIGTDTSAQIRTRLSYSSADVTLRISVRGWVDPRGRNA
jgi:hypothetical protein